MTDQEFIALAQEHPPRSADVAERLGSRIGRLSLRVMVAVFAVLAAAVALVPLVGDLPPDDVWTTTLALAFIAAVVVGSPLIVFFHLTRQRARRLGEHGLIYTATVIGFTHGYNRQGKYTALRFVFDAASVRWGGTAELPGHIDPPKALRVFAAPAVESRFLALVPGSAAPPGFLHWASVP